MNYGIYSLKILFVIYSMGINNNRFDLAMKNKHILFDC